MAKILETLSTEQLTILIQKDYPEDIILHSKFRNLIGDTSAAFFVSYHDSNDGLYGVTDLIVDIKTGIITADSSRRPLKECLRTESEAFDYIENFGKEKLKELEIECGNGYFENFVSYNDEVYSDFIDRLKEHLDATRNTYEDNKDVSMGINEEDEIEYAIQDILGAIYADAAK